MSKKLLEPAADLLALSSKRLYLFCETSGFGNGSFGPCFSSFLFLTKSINRFDRPEDTILQAGQRIGVVPG